MTTAREATATERIHFWQALYGSTVTVTELAYRTHASVATAAKWLARQASEDFLTFDRTTSRYANFCSLPQAA
jgi:hypothetical protein